MATKHCFCQHSLTLSQIQILQKAMPSQIDVIALKCFDHLVSWIRILQKAMPSQKNVIAVECFDHLVSLIPILQQAMPSQVDVIAVECFGHLVSWPYAEVGCLHPTDLKPTL